MSLSTRCGVAAPMLCASRPRCSVRAPAASRPSARGRIPAARRSSAPSSPLHPFAPPTGARRPLARASEMAAPSPGEGGQGSKPSLLDRLPRGEKVVTLGYIALWYAMNVCFNLSNKSLYKYFPFPWTVSAVHVLVGTVYCAFAYALGFRGQSFGRKVSRDELGQIFLPASMHALGHIAANLSFAAVAISLTHTVKTLEPVFSVVLQRLILGQATSLPVMASLVPIVGGVAMASAAELSFNWMGFASAMVSNFTFGLRGVLGKRTMNTIDDLSSTAIYSYTTVISLLLCLPLACVFEGPRLVEGCRAAVESLGGTTPFLIYLLAVGMFYHLYNQFAFNTLARVNPVSHGVCNVVKRIIIIGSSVLFFGNILTTQTMVGTAVALGGVWAYSELQAKAKAEAKKE